MKCALIAAATLGIGAAGPVLAQTYPGKVIRLISPSTPGGGTDIVARLISQKLSESFGHPSWSRRSSRERPIPSSVTTAVSVAVAIPDLPSQSSACSPRTQNFSRYEACLVNLIGAQLTYWRDMLTRLSHGWMRSSSYAPMTIAA